MRKKKRRFRIMQCSYNNQPHFLCSIDRVVGTLVSVTILAECITKHSFMVEINIIKFIKKVFRVKKNLMVTPEMLRLTDLAIQKVIKQKEVFCFRGITISWDFKHRIKKMMNESK